MCDLKDPRNLSAYQEVLSGQNADWMVLGYHDTRDIISLHAKGNDGLTGLVKQLSEKEVFFGFLNYQSHYVLINFVGENVNGVRKARALVHGRSVAALLNKYDVQLNVNSSRGLTEELLCSKLNISPPQPASPSAPLPPTPEHTREDTQVTTRNRSFPSSTNKDNGHRHVESDKASYEESSEEETTEEVEEFVQVTPPNLGNMNTMATSLGSTPGMSIVSGKAQKDDKKSLNEFLRKPDIPPPNESEGGLMGFLSVQGGGCYFWKRRWIRLQASKSNPDARILYLYRDPHDKYPVNSIDLGRGIESVEDAQFDVLIPNSFKLVVNGTKDPFYFFADNQASKQAIVNGLLGLVVS